MKYVNANVKAIKRVKKITCICENGNYSKCVADNSVITCDEIINVTDSVSTNVTSTVSTNFHNNKVRYRIDCYILHIVLSVIKFMFTIAIICQHYSKHRSKQKKMYCFTNNIRMEIID